MQLTAQDVECYARDGYLIKPAWFDSGTIAAACTAAERIVYGTSFAEYLQDPTAKPLADGMSQPSAHGRSEFPTGVPAIDQLFDERLVGGITQLLGAQPFYQNAHIFPRAGSTDIRHPEHPWQGYHVDHDTFSFLPASTDLAYAAVTATIFLTDVNPDCAPLHVVPGSHRQAAQLPGGPWVHDIRTVPGVPAPVPALGPAGSILFYSTYLMHAAVPFINKRAHRLLMSFTSARDSHACWTHFATPYRYGNREHFVPYWNHASPTMRTYFGWPPPGHPYYTAQTLACLALRYPAMDFSAYQGMARPVQAARAHS
jgi:hypothetical protein